jgi:hypothetical protein
LGIALRIIKTQDPGIAPSDPDVGLASRRSARLLATGLDSAQIYEEINLWNHARPAESFLMTDVDWGRMRPYTVFPDVIRRIVTCISLA